MGNKYNDNELDRWLRKHAGTGRDLPAADGWDQPSEAVWTGLRAGLDARRKRRRFLLLCFILLAGMLGSGIGYWQGTREKTTPSPEKIPVVSQHRELHLPPALLQPSVITDVPNRAKNSTSDINVSPLSKNKLIEHPAGTQTNTHKNSSGAGTGIPGVSSHATQRIPVPQTPNDARAQSEPTETAFPQVSLPAYASRPSPAEVFRATGSGEPLPLLPHAELLPVTKLPGKVTGMSSARYTAPSVPLSDHPQQSCSGWYAGAATGAIFTTRRLYVPSGKQVNGTESGAWTWQHGLYTGYRINRHWALETGFQYTGIRLQAERLINFQYQTDRELFNPNRFLYQNSTEQQIQTSLGEVDMRMDMGREPSRPILNQANIEIILRTNERVNYLRIPLLLQYRAGKGPWHWNLGAGVGFNLETGYDLQMTAARANRPGVRDISARARHRARGLAPRMLDAQLNAGFGYRIAPNWSIQLTPEFRYGLTALYKNNTFRSLALSGGIQLGIIYNFEFTNCN